jgi:hypothetical protein
MDKKLGKPPTDETSRHLATTKLAYVKPSFRYERVFETMALACGKITSSQQQCASLLKHS